MASDFQERLKAERRLLDRFGEAYRKYAFTSSQSSPEAQAEMDEIVTDLEELIGVEVSKSERSSFSPLSGTIERAEQLINHLWTHERCAWELEPALTVAQWSSMGIEELRIRVTLRPGPGTQDEVLPLFRIMHFGTVALGWGLREGIRTNSPLTLADGIVRALAAEAAKTHPLGLERKFWNRSRQFNPQRVLSLRIQRLAMCGSPERATARIEFSNVDEALALPETSIRPPTLTWPSHPTLPAPWRCMHLNSEGILHEESLGMSLTDALVELARLYRSIERWGLGQAGDAEVGEIDLETAVAMVFEDENQQRKQKWLPRMEDYRFSGQTDEEPAAAVGPQASSENYVFAQDSPELSVVSNASLAAGSGRLALKAREIWFQRFRELLEPALPAARCATLFLLDRGIPKSPFRTFVAKLPRDPGARALERPACPECGKLCDVVVNLNFTHHDLEFRLPGTALLLHVCSEHNGVAEWWHYRWVDRSAKVDLEAILRSAEKSLAGPAVRVVEYDAERVDREVTARPCAQSEAFNDRWEKPEMMYASAATKVGGGVFWIQSDPGLQDSEGNPMRHIGQVSCNEFLDIFDSGIAYILYSPATAETAVYTQCY